MAVYAAHLTRTLQGTPSVFQVTAQEALGATVKPALRKLFEYLAAVYPHKFGWSVQWYDELFLLFDACLQYHYLKHYAASFSESFYGLHRVPVNPSSEFHSGARLPFMLERASLAALVLLPYLRDRVEKKIEAWREDNEDGRLGKTRSDHIRRAAVKVYAVAHLAASSLRLAQLAAYLAGRARSPTLELRALGLRLTDAPPPSHEDQQTWAELGKSLLTGDFGSAAVTFPMVGAALLRGVEYGAFLVQFLRWWESRGGAARGGGGEGLPLPLPPTRDEGSFRYRNMCPLCRQHWRTPTVLPVSGFVFCYTCISRHVRAHAACPLTRLPAAEGSLVRLYLSD